MLLISGSEEIDIIDMNDNEYTEYKCSACKKEIKSTAIQCKKCRKMFFHPGCINKHKTYNSSQELVKCGGPYEEIKNVNEVRESRRLMTGGWETEGTISENMGMANGADRQAGADMKLMFKEIIKGELEEVKRELKKEIKSMLGEIVKNELEGIRQELKELKEVIQGRNGEAMEEERRNYAGAVCVKKKENVIIVKPKKQQESEETKKLMKEKINITEMAIGVTKLKKGNRGTVILGCDGETEMENLKTTVQNKLGKDYSILEPKGTKPKIKVINVAEEEMELEEEKLLDTIMRQNKLEERREELYMRIIKKITKESNRSGEGSGSLIIELDDKTHDIIIRRELINIGWRKCRIFNYHNVKRCFRCWGFHHIARNCMRKEACHKCAGEHSANECNTKKRKCVNCMYKIKSFNLKINDEHDALSRECPSFLKALEEEKKRTGTRTNKTNE